MKDSDPEDKARKPQTSYLPVIAEAGSLAFDCMEASTGIQRIKPTNQCSSYLPVIGEARSLVFDSMETSIELFAASFHSEWDQWSSCWSCLPAH